MSFGVTCGFYLKSKGSVFLFFIYFSFKVSFTLPTLFSLFGLTLTVTTMGLSFFNAIPFLLLWSLRFLQDATVLHEQERALAREREIEAGAAMKRLEDLKVINTCFCTLRPQRLNPLFNPTRPNPTQRNPAQPSSTQPNPTQPNPTQPNPTQPNPTRALTRPMGC